MKWVFCLVLLVFFANCPLGLGYNDTLTVRADILIPAPDIIGIAIPSFLDLGEVVIGEESGVFDVYINNTGNIDISVIPSLASNASSIFDNLFFRRIQTDPFSQIGTFQVNISKPADGENSRSQRTYLMLNLTNYDSNATAHITDLESNITFWAVAQ
jgi:hypothetical protein